MFRFLHPELLYLLIPLLLYGIYLFFRISKQRKELKRFGDTELVKELMPDLSLRRILGKDLILLGALLLMVVALARPQMGAKTEQVKTEGIEMMVCLDISNSMLSDDVKPSRLERAKAIVSKVMERMDNNKIGLIYFAGDAFVQLPITADLVSAKMFLSNASPNMIDAQGTVLEQAIRLGIRSFSTNDKVKRAIVLITDAENHEGDVMAAVKEAKEKGIIVNVIGVGSADGGPIPLPEGGYLLNEAGEMVVTKLDEQIAQEIVAASGGVYIRANDVSQTTKLLAKSLDKLDKAELEMTVYSAYNEMYYIPLIFALLLLILDFIYLERKNRYLRKVKLFEDRNKSAEQ